ncbi:hypothetical protein OHB04_22865 [Streptomyces sp. NBC_01775]|uniref:hypothetical protein n=1 Tax=Streptomyces sp. NBC_01775 TaxID=2975939 RepID=UPI002DD9B05C|nr:hypothetical protein [Streptomyces sp. NBC_01775]WSB78337.1 hypothetical protein OHB04_22865 [Streptomyces sp. NBC_01775]
MNVVRAETYYIPPRQLPPDAWANVPGAELVFRWIEYRLHRRVPLPDSTLTDVPPVYARVNQNRWLADCVCNSAAVISPADPRWACTECGYGWVDMIVPAPEEVTAIEQQLLTIPQPHLRDWWNPADPNPFNPSRPPDPPPSVPEIPPGTEVAP